jgi:hypothetical protein
MGNADDTPRLKTVQDFRREFSELKIPTQPTFGDSETFNHTLLTALVVSFDGPSVIECTFVVRQILSRAVLQISHPKGFLVGELSWLNDKFEVGVSVRSQPTDAPVPASAADHLKFEMRVIRDAPDYGRHLLPTLCAEALQQVAAGLLTQRSIVAVVSLPNPADRRIDSFVSTIN